MKALKALGAAQAARLRRTRRAEAGVHAALDAHYAATAAGPLRLGTSLAQGAGFEAVCTPLEPERLEWLKQTWLSSDEPSARAALREGLIAAGGEFALLPSIEEDLAKLLSRGQLWGPTHRTMRGAPSRCHSNSCLLFEANQDKDIALATGYALSDDGIWRQHSWCVQKTRRGPRRGQALPIETTEPRLLYFGFAMTLEEALAFADNNTDFGIELSQATWERFAPFYWDVSGDDFRATDVESARPREGPRG